MGDSPDEFGDDIIKEGVRVVQINGSGWWYYSIANPVNGVTQFKATFVMAIDWDGTPAMIGTGIYERDLPGSCSPEYVSAAGVDSAAEDRDRRLVEFVRCAALEVESKGYFSKMELQEDSRWRAGSIYVFVLDTMGNQVFTGREVALNGIRFHEWGGKSRPTDQFGGRDIPAVADTFGEAYVYYRALNPLTGRQQKKIGFLKRIVAQGVPVLVGAGYYIDD